MEPKIIIVGSPSDEKAVLDAEISLSMKGFNAESNIISADRDCITNTDADYTLLWLSKNASQDLFAIAKELNNRMKKCINIFSESMSVSKQQKEVIGGNHSIFVELNPESWIDDLSQLTCKVAPQDEGAKITPPPPPIVGVPFPSSESPYNINLNNRSKEEHNVVGEPWKVLMVMVGTIIGLFILDAFCSFHRGDSSIILLIISCGIIEVSCIRVVLSYRKQVKKNFFSLFVIAVGLILSIFFLWALVRNLS